MGSYLESALTKGEKVVYQGKVSIWYARTIDALGAHISSLFWAGPSVLGRCRNQVLHNRTCYHE